MWILTIKNSSWNHHKKNVHPRQYLKMMINFSTSPLIKFFFFYKTTLLPVGAQIWQVDFSINITL